MDWLGAACREGAEGLVLLLKDRPPDRERASASSLTPATTKKTAMTMAIIASFFE
jgi:hypothetical protein